LVALTGGCGGTPAMSDDAATESASSSSDGSSSEGSDTTGGPPASSTTEGGSTEPDPTVPPADSTTGEPICAADYGWGAAERKDVVVVVAADAAGLGGLDVDALHAFARGLASEAGDHVAVAAAPTGNEPPSGEGYAALPLPAGDDPMDVAAAVELDASFRRPHTPLRLVVITDVDTAWSDAMLRAAPAPVRLAQIDPRLVVPSVDECDAFVGFGALVTATAGSTRCTLALEPEGVVDADGVLAEQPACVLAPVDRFPPLGSGEPTLALFGIAPAGPQADYPSGPVDCRSDELGWTIEDARAGAIGLCPARCRSVASWYVSERLTAELAHDCAR
jgi:hypothetical protein